MFRHRRPPRLCRLGTPRGREGGRRGHAPPAPRRAPRGERNASASFRLPVEAAGEFLSGGERQHAGDDFLARKPGDRANLVDSRGGLARQVDTDLDLFSHRNAPLGDGGGGIVVLVVHEQL